MRYFSFLLLLGVLISVQSCGSVRMNKLMNAHNSKLSQAALSTTMSAEQKMDVLGASFVQVINESLGYVNPKNSVKHFDQFAKVNKKEIDMIMSSVEEWQGNMGEVEQILMIGKIATKSYSKDLITLLPKLEKKINRSVKTITFLSKFVKILSPKL